MQKPTIISLKNLTKVYTEKGSNIQSKALDNINLNIEEGNFLAIAGPSGSGKTTLLNIIGALDIASSGEVMIDNISLSTLSPSQLAELRLKKIGFVFQAFNLLPRTTVLENVELPLIYSDVPEEEWQDKANAAVEAVGLSSRIHHESAQLSGGEKQRVAIARALVNDPEIIFADEPTGNLDSKSGRALMEIISKLNQMGKTIVLITHEEDIAAYAKRVIHMRDGKIEKDLIRK